MVAALHIGICGAGPAGLAAALALCGLGHRITLIDQFDTPRPVGSGLILQPAGLAVLDELGLGTRIRALGSRIDRLYGTAARSGRVVLDVRYAALGEERGLAVHRAALFRVLLDAVAAAGIEIETGSHVRDLDGRFVVLDEGRRMGPFDLVVDALGARSTLLSHASAKDVRRPLAYGALWASLPWPGAPFDANELAQRYDRASVMIGVLPIGRQHEGGEAQAAFFWSLKREDHAEWREAGLAPWKDRVLRFWPDCAPLLSRITDPDQMALARYDHHTLPKPWGERLVFIGDSAHATSPQLGQGANMALIDVAVLAAALAAHRELPDALVAYAEKRKAHVRLYQAMSRVFTPFYQSDSAVLPLLRDGLVAQMSRLPPLQRLLATIVSGRLGLPR